VSEVLGHKGAASSAKSDCGPRGFDDDDAITVRTEPAERRAPDRQRLPLSGPPNSVKRVRAKHRSSKPRCKTRPRLNHPSHQIDRLAEAIALKEDERLSHWLSIRLAPKVEKRRVIAEDD
jgi:hypothetical protein